MRGELIDFFFFFLHCEKVAPFHAKWEAEGQVSRECWEKAGELGLLCSATSEKVPGEETYFYLKMLLLKMKYHKPYP